MVWRSHKRARVTAKLFEDWFENCFVHEVRNYLRNFNLYFKVPLLVDNAPGHPTILSERHPDIEVLFLPQTLHQSSNPWISVIVALKSYYTRSFDHIVQAM